MEPTDCPIRALYYLFFPGNGSGIGRYTHDLLTRMVALADVAPELVCTPGCHWQSLATYPVWPGLREIEHPVALRRRARFLVGQAANPLRLSHRARATRADVVHLCNINPLTYPLWKGRLRAGGARVAATVHDVFRAKGILSTRFENRQLARFYRSADALFVHSRQQATILSDELHVDAARVHVVPHGPYDYGQPSAEATALRRRYGLLGDKQVVLAFGHVRDDKNLDLLMESLRDFREEVHLLVAGRAGGGRNRGIEHYQGLARRLDLDRNVTFLNRFIPDQEVADLFAACDWTALPYSRSFSSQSGVLNVAVHYHRPVLVSRTGGLAEAIEDFDVGVAVEPDDLPALREGIARIIRQTAAGHSYEFERYTATHSWDETARRTAAVYRTLLGRTARPEPVPTG